MRAYGKKRFHYDSSYICGYLFIEGKGRAIYHCTPFCKRSHKVRTTNKSAARREGKAVCVVES